MKANKLIVVMALLAASTSANAFGYPNWAYDWKKTGDSLPRTNKLVSKEEVQQHCPRNNFVVHACAVRTKTQCFVYHWQELTARIDAHEQKHCDGYSHSRMDEIRFIEKDPRESN